MKILLAGPGTGKTSRVKENIKEFYPDAENILVLSFTNATVNDLISSFMDWPNVKCYTLHSYALKINHLPNLHILDNNDETELIKKYSKDLKINFNDLCLLLGCITFDDMIDKCIQFMQLNPVYAEHNIGNLDLLVVDEFQDFNEIERKLVYLISNYAGDTIVLGDDDQSIYGFKDADPSGIITLYNDNGTEKIENENICHRCPDVIVDYCKKLIQNNKNRVDKPWNISNKEGNIIFMQKLTQKGTDKYICNEIKRIKNIDDNSSILILSPVGFYVNELKEKLEEEEINYIDFWNRKLDKDVLTKIWWLRAIYTDKKVLNLMFLGKELSYPKRKKLKDELSKYIHSDFDQDKLINSINNLNLFPLPFNQYLVTPPPISQFILSHPEYSELWELINELNINDSLKDLVKNINPNIEFEKGEVNIMSIHKSKGLEADYVFITCLVDGILPNKIRGIDSIESQRRLLFVGMTRAKKSLYMMSTVEWEGKFVHRVDKSQFKYNYRKKVYNGKTSKFIEEMNN